MFVEYEVFLPETVFLSWSIEKNILNLVIVITYKQRIKIIVT